MKTTASELTVKIAIEKVNLKRNYQISLNRAEQKGKWFHFTLKSPSKVSGARTSWSGRNMPKASWHAHGFVMDAIFDIDPAAKIVSLGKILEKDFNWEDKQIGSIMQPCWMSETSIL
jgi:hypothetical protein